MKRSASSRRMNVSMEEDTVPPPPSHGQNRNPKSRIVVRALYARGLEIVSSCGFCREQGIPYSPSSDAWVSGEGVLNPGRIQAEIQSEVLPQRILDLA